MKFYEIFFIIMFHHLLQPGLETLTRVSSKLFLEEDKILCQCVNISQ